MVDLKEKDGSQPRSDKAGVGIAERDIIALGIATAAIIMFVGTGGTVLPQVVRSLAGYGLGPDKVLVNALLLNIALIIFGWRRYRQLSQEVTERRKAEKHARQLAETDPLTGLLNKRSFGGEIEQILTEAERRGKGVAVMMIDLDNFKQVNDFNGHNAGDVLLTQSAKRIGQVLAHGSLLARVGGDEFACAIEFDFTHPETIDQRATAILNAICQPSLVVGINFEVTASIGIARSDMLHKSTLLDATKQHGEARNLVEMADIAMYHAKRQGRSCFFWFEQQMGEEMRFRNELEVGIREGVSAGEFVPYFEQQIDLQTGKLCGFEMLARWNSPKFGLIGPDIFISIAEDIGVIAELSESVISQALDDARDWDPELTLAVNISPLQLRDPWFAQKLLKLLVEANFPPQRLEIEITESCLHENLTVVRSLIASLKNQGIRVSIDDFGTGYSSLAQLRSLPFDRIKIDRSFVTSLVGSDDNAAIVDAIAMLGKGLNLPITIEGIETQEILEKVLPYGEIKGQGYLYGHPQSAAETNLWLADRSKADTGGESVDPQPSQDVQKPATDEAQQAGTG
ncbi:MAG: EAL domain-containing protein [Novosphingobium sp.]|nr:EAL domain-containing protein [Novosphingobium sp.]